MPILSPDEFFYLHDLYSTYILYSCRTLNPTVNGAGEINLPIIIIIIINSAKPGFCNGDCAMIQ